jgi:acetyl esterase/lipase
MNASSWYLVASAAGALSTANAYRPLSRRGPFAVMSYFAGWPTSELPLHTVVLQVVLTAAALPLGVLDHAEGRIGLVLSVGSWLALVLLHRRARGASALYDAALREALGADYADRVVHPRSPETADQLGVLQMLRVRRRHVQERDISYGSAGSANLLDIWRPKDLKPGDRAPVLIQIPGGAWVLGKKTGQSYPLMNHMVERGWICVCINYRLAPKNLWPAHVIDVKKAIAWVRSNIEDFGGDPSFIALTGGSAGGHLTALAALTWDNPTYQPGFEQADTRVQAALPFYGVFDWSDEVDTGGKIFLPHLQRTVMKVKWADDPAPFAMASPLRQIRADAPPFLISVGTNDTMVSPRQSRYFAPRLRALSEQPVAFTELSDAQHTFDIFTSPRARAAAHSAGQFLGVVYGEHRVRR